MLSLGTYCQQREVEAITEGVEDDDGTFFFFFCLVISRGYRMNTSAIKDLLHDWYLKILSKLYEPLDEYNLKKISNIASSVNPWLLELSYDYLDVVWLRKLRTRER